MVHQMAAAGREVGRDWSDSAKSSESWRGHSVRRGIHKTLPESLELRLVPPALRSILRFVNIAVLEDL